MFFWRVVEDVLLKRLRFADGNAASDECSEKRYVEILCDHFGSAADLGTQSGAGIVAGQKDAGDRDVLRCSICGRAGQSR